MAEMIWVDASAHRFFKKIAKTKGSSIQKVASVLAAHLAKNPTLLSGLEFPEKKSPGRKRMSAEEKAEVSKRMASYWKAKRKAVRKARKSAAATVETSKSVENGPAIADPNVAIPLPGPEFAQGAVA